MITTQKMWNGSDAVPPVGLALKPPQNRNFGIYYNPENGPRVCEVIHVSRDKQRYLVCRIPNCKLSLDSDGLEVSLNQFTLYQSYGEALFIAERTMQSWLENHKSGESADIKSESAG